MNKPSPLVVTLLQWVIILLMPIFLTLTSLYLFITPQLVDWQYSRPDFPPAQLFTPEARLYNATQTVLYIRSQTSLDDLKNLGVYNEREIKHLIDVEVVTRNMFIIQPLSLVLIAIALFVLARNPLTRIHAARSLLYGGIATIIFITFIGLFAAFAFDSFFVTFHHLFFEGDSWLFNYTDSLIQFYPEPFWVTASLGIALFVFICAVIVSLIGWFWMRRLSNPPLPLPVKA